jgi:hypothetical protein
MWKRSSQLHLFWLPCCQVIIIPLLYPFFCGSGGWTQGLMLWQTLYYLSHSPIPLFLLTYFWA